ncbi:TatD family hydrolase [bacterium]|nr:TatD family hydrolase [bacterium]
MSQCDLAQELNLPIIIHSRDAFNETYEILKGYQELTVYIHCR